MTTVPAPDAPVTVRGRPAVVVNADETCVYVRYPSGTACGYDPAEVEAVTP